MALRKRAAPGDPRRARRPGLPRRHERGWSAARQRRPRRHGQTVGHRLLLTSRYGPLHRSGPGYMLGVGPPQALPAASTDRGHTLGPEAAAFAARARRGLRSRLPPIGIDAIATP